jgi:hypothetical protein
MSAPASSGQTALLNRARNPADQRIHRLPKFNKLRTTATVVSERFYFPGGSGDLPPSSLHRPFGTAEGCCEGRIDLAARAGMKPPSRSLSPCHFRQCRVSHLCQRIRRVQILANFLHQMLSFEILHERVQGLAWDLEEFSHISRPECAGISNCGKYIMNTL